MPEYFGLIVSHSSQKFWEGEKTLINNQENPPKKIRKRQQNISRKIFRPGETPKPKPPPPPPNQRKKFENDPRRKSLSKNPCNDPKEKNSRKTPIKKNL